MHNQIICLSPKQKKFRVYFKAEMALFEKTPRCGSCRCKGRLPSGLYICMSRNAASFQRAGFEYRLFPDDDIDQFAGNVNDLLDGGVTDERGDTSVAQRQD